MRCACGETIHANAAHAGRVIRHRCGRTLRIPGGTSKRRLSWPTLRVSPRILRLAAVAAWGYLATAVVAALVLWLSGDRWWLGTVLLFGPRWPILIPAIPLLLAAAAIRPRLLLPAGLATLISLGPFMGWNAGWRRLLAGGAPRTVRLITFNVEGGANPQAAIIPDRLADYDADVLAFQECPPVLSDASRWPADWSVHAEGTLCLASRWPILRTLRDDRVLTGEQGGTGTVVIFRLSIPGDSIDIAVVHLETPRKGLERLRYGFDVGKVTLNTLVRDAGSRRASRWIAANGHDPIIAGDFNMPVESRIYREHWSACPNAFTAAGRGFGYTRFMPKFSVRIDHVLACGGWQALSVAVGPDLGSDHKPLIVDLGRR